MSVQVVPVDLRPRLPPDLSGEPISIFLFVVSNIAFVICFYKKKESGQKRVLLHSCPLLWEPHWWCDETPNE